MATRHLLRAASAAAASVSRPTLLAQVRLPRHWAVVSAAAAEVPQGAAQQSDVFAALGSFGVPTALVVAATTGFFLVAQQLGAMREKVEARSKAISDAKEASSKAISDAKSDAAAITKTNQDAAAAVIAAYKEAAASAIASTEAKLAAAEKVIAALMAGVPVTAELATLKAMKGEPKRETPKSEL